MKKQIISFQIRKNNKKSFEDYKQQSLENSESFIEVRTLRRFLENLTLKIHCL